jgi:tetratricopeptide (TPR) repeat protein
MDNSTKIDTSVSGKRKYNIVSPEQPKKPKLDEAADSASPKKLDAIVGPLDVELDLAHFSLLPRTKQFFEQLAGLLTCKLKADGKYKEVRSREEVLLKPKYDSFGTSPQQEGNDFMTVDEVRKDASIKKEAFDKLLTSVATTQGLNPEEVVLVDGEPIEKEWGAYKVLTLAALKSEERSREKTNDEYNGNAKFLCDVGRATIVCRTEQQIANVIDSLWSIHGVDVVRMKNRFAHPTYTGIRDILINLEVENHIFEVQVHLADLLANDSKSNGHRFYEFFRDYFVGTIESYRKRMEIFHRLGHAVRTGDISAGVRAILEGTDTEKLEALEEITNADVFAGLELNLMAKKRLLALEMRKGNDERILERISSIAYIYSKRGAYTMSLEWYQRALDGRKASLGREHSKTYSTANKMANVYSYQGDHETALEWYHKALDGRETSLGHRHPKTLGTVNKIANVYSFQGKHEKALEWYQRALDGIQSLLGEEHPKTLAIVNNMANQYKFQGDLKKALEWYQRALEVREASLGKGHPDTLATVNNMAGVYSEQGEYAKALQGFQRALDGREASLGKEHPNTLATVNNLAGVYREQRDYKKALEWYQRALDGRVTSLGKTHPRTLATVDDMADVYLEQRDYTRALEWYQRVLDGKEASLGRNDPKTLSTVNKIANAYSFKRDHERALEWYQRALDGREASLGRNHPSTLDTVNNMANVYRNQGKYNRAREWYQRALEGREAFLGKDHPKTMATIKNMILLEGRLARYQASKELTHDANK